MPERVIGKTDNVKIIDAIILYQAVEELAIHPIICTIRQMDHQLNRRIDVANRLEAAGHELRKSLAIVIARQLANRPHHTIVDFVTNLDHIRHNTLALEIPHDFLGVLVDMLDQLVLIVLLPGIGCILLQRVCPAVTIMEIHQHFKSQCLDALREFYGSHLIGVAATAQNTMFRVIPNAHANPVDPMILHDLEFIHLLAVGIVEFCP